MSMMQKEAQDFQILHLRAKRKERTAFILQYAFRVLIGLIIICPLFYAVSVSFMPRTDVMASPPRFFPSAFTLENYQRVLDYIPFGRYLLNTMVVCAIEIICQVLFCSFAAYAFTFFEFKGKNLLFTLVLVTMMIPGETTVVSNYLSVQKLHVIDTYLAIVLPTLVSGMGIFMMRQFFLTVPKEMKEAATVDGCGSIAFFFKILLPISLSNVTSLGIYVFVHCYNRFFWPLLVTNSQNMRTMQIGASYLRDAESYNYGVVMAGTVLCLIPAIVVFIVGMKYLVKGMTAGAVKG